jgi:hypothetical protein
MSIAVRSATHPGHVRAECAGPYSLDAILDAVERIFTLTAEAGRDAVLVDVRNVTAGEPTMADRYQIAVHIAELQAAQHPRIRMAAVGNEPFIHPERFGEIVATRHGATARTFTDDATALDWLLGTSRTS